MKITVLSLFPELCEAYFGTSIMARAVAKGLISYKLINIRDFAVDKHRSCDDAPYGGGAGMVLLPEPLGNALDSVDAGSIRTIYPSPSGIPFTQRMAVELSGEKELIFLCGRYEGVDQRILDLYVDDEISVGDYVLSSGELAALVIIDGIYRLLDGVINRESLEEESFSNGLLEYPHYTRPEIYRGIPVPDVLLSGHHARIAQWRLNKRLEKTRKNRPDMLEVERKDSLEGQEQAIHAEQSEKKGNKNGRN
jgi:tRNA (guanine37-N1)-methyltransferase